MFIFSGSHIFSVIQLVSCTAKTSCDVAKSSMATRTQAEVGRFGRNRRDIRLPCWESSPTEDCANWTRVNSQSVADHRRGLLRHRTWAPDISGFGGLGVHNGVKHQWRAGLDCEGKGD